MNDENHWSEVDVHAEPPSQRVSASDVTFCSVLASTSWGDVFILQPALGFYILDVVWLSSFMYLHCVLQLLVDSWRLERFNASLSLPPMFKIFFIEL